MRNIEEMRAQIYFHKREIYENPARWRGCNFVIFTHKSAEPKQLGEAISQACNLTHVLLIQLRPSQILNKAFHF